MNSLPFQLPDPNEALSPHAADSPSALQMIARRRSTPIKMMDPQGAAPTGDLLQNLLSAAMRVPDHRKIEPWRLIIIEGDARERLGEELAARFAFLNPDADEDAIAEERNRLLRAPVCVSVVSSPDHDHKTPVWEQELSSGALCMNLLYAAQAAGFAASWISEWWAFDAEINKTLGLVQGERIAGHIFLGTAKADIPERPRPAPAGKITTWKG